MPNWCFCSVAIVCRENNDKSKEELRDLHDKMRSLEERETTLVENGFGKTWLGNLVTLLGGDCNTIYCRGEWEAVEMDVDGIAIRFTIMSAWGEPDEVFQFIEEMYPSMKVYYIAEEPGMCHYVTNDAEGEYFPDRYYFAEPDDCEPSYYTEDELDDFLSDVGEFLGCTLKTAEEAFEAVCRYNERQEDWDKYAEVRVYKVINTETSK